jgi:hypothetical protein
MKQTPQNIGWFLRSPKRDGTDIERDAVTRGLGIFAHDVWAPTPGKGKVQHCGKEIREPDEQVLPGLTDSRAEPPSYPTLWAHT